MRFLVYTVELYISSRRIAIRLVCLVASVRHRSDPLLTVRVDILSRNNLRLADVSAFSRIDEVQSSPTMAST
ncbi:hypothetical protein BD310DRAFT_927889 [Dichomitus squalens]|uniref:Uncharacterized protein n=1 Tax=Dichomitus squalens TaxID=114155 RepID=A0A4Q9PU76_9APHY|nr:hypothetical protein BD310DRAFT_927889 [Dichomitus squalens]